MIPDHYQPLCDEHNRRMARQFAQARTRLLRTFFGLGLLLPLLLLLLAHWLGCWVFNFA